MPLYVMADLHLSSDRSKSMEVFGARWAGYMEKIRKNWSAVVKETDTVIVPGDISWGLRLEDTADDFRFLDALPGEKLIGKGNHDFWWSTQKKIEQFWAQLGASSLRLLSNNAFLREGVLIAGTRGWFLDEEQQRTVGEVDYKKIVNREVIRLRMSLDAAVKLRESEAPGAPVCAFLHFPPVWGDFVSREILDVLHEYGVRDCYFGHIHGAYSAPPARIYEDITFRNCAADYLNFTPAPLRLQTF